MLTRPELCLCRQASISKLHGHVDVAPVRSADVLTDTALVHTLDLTSMTADQAYFTADFTLTASCQVCYSCAAACSAE